APDLLPALRTRPARARPDPRRPRSRRPARRRLTRPYPCPAPREQGAPMSGTNDHTPGYGTRAIHAGQRPDPTTGAIMTPVYLTSAYVQTSPGQSMGYAYSRSGNPTRAALEANLASLEGGRHGFAF